jgi:hypothetical protein
VAALALGGAVVALVLQPWRGDPAAGRDPAVPALGGRVRVVQRRTADVPGSGGRLQVHLGDITRGQVELTVNRTDGGGVLPPQSAAQGDRVGFRFEGRTCRVTVVELTNVLVGDDYAVLDFEEDRGAAAEGPAMIERLLEAVRASGAVFIRNGEEHTPEEAADHLRRKWRTAGDRVKTPEDFIDRCATASSTSGEAYRMRLENGTTVTARDWLLGRLVELRG